MPAAAFLVSRFYGWRRLRRTGKACLLLFLLFFLSFLNSEIRLRRNELRLYGAAKARFLLFLLFFLSFLNSESRFLYCWVAKFCDLTLMKEIVLWITSIFAFLPSSLLAFLPSCLFAFSPTHFFKFNRKSCIVHLKSFLSLQFV